MEITTRRKQHAFAIGFTIVLGIAIHLRSGYPLFSDPPLFFCLVTFTQIELFISYGTAIFRFVPGHTPREITWRIVLRFILFYILCFVTAILVYFFYKILFYLKNGDPISEMIPNFMAYEMSGWLTSTTIGLTFGAFSFFIMLWQDALKKAQKLHEQNLMFRYETLNHQVNPHFLFNSFNTLASFIKTDTDIAEQYVIKLAELYRYITDYSDQQLIDLQKELSFANDYFYLHKIRDGEKIQMNVSIPEDVSGKIIPVSLQILIENAIKHNRATSSSPLCIDVFWEDHCIIVRNNIQAMATVQDSPKKGLENLKQRYQLLMEQTVIVEEREKFFVVKVPVSK